MTLDRRDRRKIRTRQAIMETSLALFAKRGIYAPSIEEITEGADVGKGTFYQYFPSREDLIAALVREGFDKLLEYLGKEVRGAKSEKEVVKTALNAHGAFFHQNPEYLLLLHQARGWLKLPGTGKSPIRSELARYVDLIAKLLPSQIGELVIPFPQRLRMALVLGGFVSGVLSFEYILGGGLQTVPDLAHDGSLLVDLLNV